MDILRAGSTELPVLALFGFADNHGGVTGQAIRISLPEDITEEQIRNLLENPWSHYNENGELVAVHSGYNMVKSYEITFLKVPDEAKLMSELNAAAAELAEARRLAAEKEL